MTSAEFQERWDKVTDARRSAWLAEDVLRWRQAGDGEYLNSAGAATGFMPDGRGKYRFDPASRLDHARVVEDAVEARGLAEAYAMALEALASRENEYGPQSKGWKWWLLIHARAELRCRAALMAALGVQP
jgi:hypothetical protein